MEALRRTYLGKENPNWRGGTSFHECVVCGKEFRGYKGKKYCSRKCFLKDVRKSVVFTCLNCEKKTIVPFYQRQRKYCSLKCAYESPFRVSKNRVKRVCENCGKLFETVKSAVGKYCGRACRARAMFKGKKQSRIQIQKRVRSFRNTMKGRESFFSKFNREVLHKDPKYISRRVKAIVKKPNKAEKRLVEMLQKHNLPFVYTGDGRVILEGLCPDFMDNDGSKRIIEVFGRAFHDSNIAFVKVRSYQTEEGRKAVFSKLGFRTLIIWDDELDNEDLVIEKIWGF